MTAFLDRLGVWQAEHNSVAVGLSAILQARYVAPDGLINLSDTTQARHEGEIEDSARSFIASARH
ncbi:hypothetical protein [Mycobacterium sp. SA01]|uniref:hypothetical protein n=1 Tax=Mycobacterium sp. SA01 TaxID=3238820 RepID=UPI00351B6C81